MAKPKKSGSKVKASKKKAAAKKEERVVVLNGVHFDQACAFVQVLTKAPPVKAHLEAILGLGHVATWKDFSSHDGEAQERADSFLGYLADVIKQLDGRLREQPRQLEMVKFSDGERPKDEPAPTTPEEQPAMAASA